MSLKAKVEAIIYAAEEPITLEQLSALLKDVVLAELAAAKERAAQEETEPAAPHVQSIRAEARESSLLPELDDRNGGGNGENGEQLCPEPGPLMPHGAASEETEAEENGENGAAESSEAGASADSATNSEVNATSAEQAPEAAESEESSASVAAPETAARKRQPKKTEQEIAEDKAVREHIRGILVELVTDYAGENHGIEIRQVAGGFRMATKPEHHDVVRAFAKSLKPPIRLSLAALETLAVIAYKQPITGPEISDIRGVESAGVLGTLLDRKLITTAGRKQVIGRPMQYRTSKDFLLRFGLNDVGELPSMEEFSQLASDATIEVAEAKETPSLFETSEQPADSDVILSDGEQPSASKEEPSAEEADSGSEAERPIEH